MVHGWNKIPWPVLAAAAFVLIFSNVFSWVVFEHTPRIHDEIDYLFQARLFASGRLYAPSPCARDFFAFPHTINNGRWYSMYTPGYPLLLAIGIILGAPWIVNPLLAALTILLFYALGVELYDRRTGTLAAVLGAASIWFLLMSSSFMNHTSSLFFASLFLVFFIRSLSKPTLLNGLLAGVGLGFMIMIRPYNALIFGLPFLLSYAWKTLPELKSRAGNILAAAGGTAFFITVLGVYNQITNGSPFRMGYSVVFGDKILPGFGNTGLAGTAFTMLQGWDNIFAYLKALNRDLFGWPLSSLWALLPLVVLKRPAEERRKDLLLASGILSMLVGLFFFWGTLIALGPRLMFETVVLLVLLSARGVLEFQRFLRSGGGLKPRAVQALTAGLLILFIGHGFFVRFPRWIWPEDSGYPLDTIGHDLAGTSPAIGRTLRSLSLGRAVVFMRILRSPSRFYPAGVWSSGFLFNDPDLKADIIYARDQGADNVRLMDCHPDRRFFIYLGTLERGLLIPLERSGSAVSAGPPLIFNPDRRGRVRLVGRPQDLFKLYSKDFQSFLDEVARSADWTAWDVPHLIERGLAYMKGLDYRRAAYSYEAALQVETDPLWRDTLLNRLLSCYFKLGLRKEADRIRRRMMDSGYNPKKYYDILPERGF
jgi:pentatricopeptide repeat protein